jgi:hypothetical protein
MASFQTVIAKNGTASTALAPPPQRKEREERRERREERGRGTKKLLYEA